jgi:hypothetical protein
MDDGLVYPLGKTLPFFSGYFSFGSASTLRTPCVLEGLLEAMKSNVAKLS